MPEPLDFMVGEKLLERFRAGVGAGEPDACWLWRGPKNGEGYGQIHICEGSDRQAVSAHRVAWRLANGAIPAGLWVLHSCDVPACCNPAHLRVGTAQDNHDDMAVRGRARLGGLSGRRGDAHPRTRYGAAVRARAVELWRGGATMTAIAKDLGCDRVSVSRWVEDALLASGERVGVSRTYLRCRPAGVSPGPGRVAGAAVG